MKLKDLKLNDRNPRRIGEAKLESLKKSITDFEKMLAIRPIVVDETNTVLGGNMRLRALQALGYKEIPEEWVKRADDLTEEEKRQFIIKDNVGFGEWDWDTLANEWDAEELAEWGLDVPDTWGQEAEAQEDDFEVPDVVHTDIGPGDLIEIGRHRLLCGDSTSADDIRKLMDGVFANAVLTDPPYGQNQPGVPNDDPKINAKLMNDCAAIMPIKSGVIVAFNSTRTFPNWLNACENAGFLFERMLWLFKKAQMAYPWRGWILKSESILVHSTGEPSWNDVHPYVHDTYELVEVSGELPDGIGWHGSVKPQVVVQDIMKRISKPDQIIHDPFLGSGTTMVAAHQLGRTCYGMEIDPKYCQVVIDRMLKLEPDIEVKINGKEYAPPKD